LAISRPKALRLFFFICSRTP